MTIFKTGDIVIFQGRYGIVDTIDFNDNTVHIEEYTLNSSSRNIKDELQLNQQNWTEFNSVTYTGFSLHNSVLYNNNSVKIKGISQGGVVYITESDENIIRVYGLNQIQVHRKKSDFKVGQIICGASDHLYTITDIGNDEISCRDGANSLIRFKFTDLSFSFSDLSIGNQIITVHSTFPNYIGTISGVHEKSIVCKFDNLASKTLTLNQFHKVTNVKIGDYVELNNQPFDGDWRWVDGIPRLTGKIVALAHLNGHYVIDFGPDCINGSCSRDLALPPGVKNDTCCIIKADVIRRVMGSSKSKTNSSHSNKSKNVTGNTIELRRSSITIVRGERIEGNSAQCKVLKTAIRRGLITNRAVSCGNSSSFRRG